MNKDRQHSGVIDFTFISNPIGPSNKARHVMRRAIRRVDRLPQTHFLTRYLCSTEGIAEEQLLLGQWRVPYPYSSSANPDAGKRTIALALSRTHTRRFCKSST